MNEFLSFPLSLSTLFLSLATPFVVLGYRLTRARSWRTLRSLDLLLGTLFSLLAIALLVKLALAPPRSNDAKLLTFMHILPLVYCILTISVLRRFERIVQGSSPASPPITSMTVAKPSSMVWSDIVLPLPLKEELIGVSDLFRANTLFEKSVRSGLLFLGPNGSGKSMSARMVASGARANYLQVRLDELVISTGDRTAQSLQSLVEKAKRSVPVIVHLQEIDCFGRGRARGISSVSALVPSVLHTLDQLVALPGVLVIGEATEPQFIEEWMTRPGRLSRVVRFQLPTALERKELLSKYLSAERAEKTVSVDKLAQVLEGFSARAIKEAGERIDLLIEGKRRSGDTSPVSEHELLSVLSQVPRG